jgi:hypothetical protein
LLDSVLFATNFIFNSEIVTIINEVTRQEFSCGAMFNNKHRVGLNWLSDERRSITFDRDNSPYGVINWLRVQADLLVP